MTRIIALLLICIPALAAGNERIVDYDVDITIEPSGQVLVTEHITVEARGQSIRRGIYRDFPTSYRDRHGRRVKVPFDVVSVRRNGGIEDWHTESIWGGVRVYFGSANRMLSHGEHRYEFTYRTDRQIGFFDDFDELYWNVTGNHWEFPIERAAATVHLPESVNPADLRIDAYTGPEGSQAQDYRYAMPAGNRVQFAATRTLSGGEGLTIAVGFPKGLVREPTAAEKTAMFVRDNRGMLLALAGLVLVLVWYLSAWHRVGRDPAAGAIYPRYQPPEEYSPGMLRYIWRMGYDNTCFAAALVSLAVKGATVLEKEGKDYVANKGEGTTDSPTEQALLTRLFRSGSTSLKFVNKNHSRVSAVIKAHEQSLLTRMEGHYFKLNRIWMVPGIILSMLAVMVMVVLVPGEEMFVGLFLTVFGIIWNVFTSVLVFAVIRTWRDLDGVISGVSALFLTLFSIPFVVAGVAVLVMFGVAVGILPALVLVAVVVINGVFWNLMRAPTLRGRRLLDHIEGLRMYLNVAERDEIESRHGDAPPQTFEEFERLLPYAVALDCADTWAGRFEAAIREAEAAGTAQSRGWYHATASGTGSFSGKSFAAGISTSLAAAATSSAAAPGSSSGGGGGGFSGGGGGGGGGGGW